jgi:hypothetical protein
MVDKSALNPTRPTASAARWITVALLAVIAGCLLVQLGAGTAPAAAQISSGGKSNVFAVAGQITSDSYGLYLVDVEAQRVSVYQYLPNIRRLQLRAVRNYSFDLRLDEYNTEPLPREIKKLVEQHQPLGEPTTRP